LPASTAPVDPEAVAADTARAMQTEEGPRQAADPAADPAAGAGAEARPGAGASADLLATAGDAAASQRSEVADAAAKAPLPAAPNPSPGAETGAAEQVLPAVSSVHVAEGNVSTGALGEAGVAQGAGAETMSAAPVADAQDATSPRYVDAERNLQRISDAMRHSVRQGVRTAHIRLSPPDLGGLRMEVAVKAGVVTAHLEADTAQARDLLMGGLSQLRQHLEEQGLRIGEFTVDYDAGDSEHSQQDRGFAEHWQRRRRLARRRDEGVEGEEEQSRAPPGAVGGASGRLNMIA